MLSQDSSFYILSLEAFILLFCCCCLVFFIIIFLFLVSLFCSYFFKETGQNWLESSGDKFLSKGAVKLKQYSQKGNKTTQQLRSDSVWFSPCE